MERKVNPSLLEVTIGSDDFLRNGNGEQILNTNEGKIWISHDSYWIDSHNFGVKLNVHNSDAVYHNIRRLLADGYEVLWDYIENEILKRIKAKDVLKHINWEKDMMYSVGRESVKEELRNLIGVSSETNGAQEVKITNNNLIKVPEICANCVFYVATTNESGRCSCPDSLEDIIKSGFSCDLFKQKQ